MKLSIFLFLQKDDSDYEEEEQSGDEVVMAKDGGLYKRKKKEMEFFLDFPFLHTFPEISSNPQ